MNSPLFVAFTQEELSVAEEYIKKDDISQLPRLMCTYSQKELVEKCVDSYSVNLLYRLLRLPKFLFFNPEQSYQTAFDTLAKDLPKDDSRQKCIDHVVKFIPELE